jgi:hypothetical protein
LVAHVVSAGVVTLLLVLSLALWQGMRLHSQIDGLSLRAAKLQSALDAKSVAIQTAQPPDVVQSLPDAPSVAQIMQTLQLAADKESAQVMSLQAEDHAPTPTALGHLDLVVSIKAPYPSIVVVIQQVLDRYPGATLRQLNLAHTVAPALTMPVVAAPPNGPTALRSMTESEAHVTLAFWRRPLGVQVVRPSDRDASEPVAAPSSAAAPGALATQLAPRLLPAASTRAASGTK